MEELKKEEPKKEKGVARTRKIEGTKVIMTHVTKSEQGWSIPMTWTFDFEGTAPQEVLAMAAEHCKIKARAKYGVKALSEVEAREKYAEHTFLVKDLAIPGEKAPRVQLSADDKRVMGLAQKYMGEGLKFTEAYRKALDEIELEDMEKGEAE